MVGYQMLFCGRCVGWVSNETVRETWGRRCCALSERGLFVQMQWRAGTGYEVQNCASLCVGDFAGRKRRRHVPGWAV